MTVLPPSVRALKAICQVSDAPKNSPAIWKAGMVARSACCHEIRGKSVLLVRHSNIDKNTSDVFQRRRCIKPVFLILVVSSHRFPLEKINAGIVQFRAFLICANNNAVALAAISDPAGLLSEVYALDARMRFYCLYIHI